jgi:hypothetical protein
MREQGFKKWRIGRYALDMQFAQRTRSLGDDVLKAW